jgi:polyisoprenyl-phosphate glycosyltransferase
MRNTKEAEMVDVTASVQVDRETQARAPFLSVVIPVYNEESNIAPLLAQLGNVLEQMPMPHEIILIDDGSRDGTWDAIEMAAATRGTLRAFRLARNFGHQNALLAGLHQSKGDLVVSMDGDLQHPPEIIPQLVAQWSRGYKIVVTRRRDHEITGFLKRASSRYFYKFFSTLAGFPIHEGASDFRLIDRKPLDVLLRFRDSTPFLRGSIELLGFPKTILDFDVQPRHSGSSKYTVRKMLRFANHALIAHSTVPLRIGIWIGIATAFFAFLELIFAVAQALRGDTVAGWASTIGVTSLLFGVMFLLIGIMGAYIADMHMVLRHRPLFIISDQTDDTGGGRTTRS